MGNGLYSHTDGKRRRLADLGGTDAENAVFPSRVDTLGAIVGEVEANGGDRHFSAGRYGTL